jgi:DNA-binding NtrC family response regulator
MDILRNDSWPGNVRELQNVVCQSVLKTNGPMLMPDFLPDQIRRRVDKSPGSADAVRRPPKCWD